MILHVRVMKEEVVVKVVEGAVVVAVNEVEEDAV